MRQAVAHLVALGHRKIAWVGGPVTSWSTQHRSIGLSNALYDQGTSWPGSAASRRRTSGIAAADQAVATGATAVVAYNDLVAIGLLARLHARGISVPGDLSVVGIDDIAMSRMARPALTTVRLPKQEAGRIAVELLLAVLDDPDPDTAIGTAAPCTASSSSGSPPGPHHDSDSRDQPWLRPGPTP